MPRGCMGSFDEALLSGFLDGVLTVRKRQMVRTHLLGCARCRKVLSELARMRQACLAARCARPRT